MQKPQQLKLRQQPLGVLPLFALPMMEPVSGQQTKLQQRLADMHQQQMLLVLLIHPT
jgi:hypothetical protein